MLLHNASYYNKHNDIKKKLIFSLCSYVNVVMLFYVASVNQA